MPRDDVPVLQADLLEDRILLDGEQSEPGRLPVLEMRHRTDLGEELIHVLHRLVDLGTVDDEVAVATLLDGTAARLRRGGRGASLAAGLDDLEDLLSLAAFQHHLAPFDPDERAVLQLVADAVELVRLVRLVLDDREGIDAYAGCGAQELGVERDGLHLLFRLGGARRIEDVLRR